MRKSFLLWPLIMVIFAMFTASCGSPVEQKADLTTEGVTLSLWGWINSGSLDEKIVQEAVQEFNDTNPYHDTIEYQTFNDEFKIKIAAETAANNTPDMFFTWEEGFLAPFVSSGNVIPIDDMIEKNRFIPGIFDHVTMDGKVYAMPLVQTVELVYYNKAIFDKYGIQVPHTMDDMLAVVRTLRSKGVTPIELGNKDTWPGGLILNTLAYRYGGGGLFRKLAGGEEAFTDEPFVNAARDFTKLVVAGAFEPNTNSIDLETARRRFMEGQAAMWVVGSWELATLSAERRENGLPNPLHDHLGFFNWPAVNNGAVGQEAWIVSPDYNIAVSRNVKDKKAAAYFLRLISSPKYQNRMADILHLPATVSREAADKTDPLVKELLRELGQAQDTLTFPDRIMGQQTIGGAVNNSAQELLAGRDLTTVLERLEAQAQPFRAPDR